MEFSELLNRAVTEPGVILKAYSAFYGYSFGNRLLAWSQCEARGIAVGPIASFMGWKEKGRSVKKGEKAIQLCMPVTVKVAATEAGAEDGRFTRFVYKNNWFVLCQTEGADVVAEPVPGWDAGAALVALDITEEVFAGLDGNCQGYARGRVIAVSPVAELPHKTRFHELGHVVLGHTSDTVLSDDDRTPRDVREVEAEAVALCCLEALGLPGADACRGYIQNWNQGNAPIAERSAQRIFKAADQILKAGQTDEVEAIATEVERAISTESEAV